MTYTVADIPPIGSLELRRQTPIRPIHIRKHCSRCFGFTGTVNPFLLPLAQSCFHSKYCTNTVLAYRLAGEPVF